MQLTPIHLENYVRFIRPQLSAEEQKKTKQGIEAQLESGQRNLALTRIALDQDGEIAAAISLSPMGEDWSFLSPLLYAPNAPKAFGLPLLQEVVDAARHAKIGRISARIELDQLSPDYEAEIIRLGFNKIGSRIEFKSDVSLLPGEEGSPLTWVNMDSLGFDKCAELLGEVGRGAPDWEDDDDPHHLLKEYFSDPNLSDGPDCVHIGRLGSKNVALVIAQVDKRDGWSRLTYMGLIPEYQGKKLGAWVHRHGFSMLKAQDGQEYHGGCSMDNKAMWALFETHGCKELRRLSEWSWRAVKEG